MGSQRFSPYTDNGGTVVAIAGDDYAIIASDTRLPNGYQIYTREQPKLFQLTSRSVLGSTGCWCDITTFVKVIQARLKGYLHDHSRIISTPACAQLISNMLYYKRFFPYYISNILAGLDGSGQGVVYSYDPIGHCEKHMYRAGGSSCSLLQPMLDNRIGLKNIQNANAAEWKLSKEEATKLIKDLFVSAAERDIYCGDSVAIQIMTSSGIENLTYELRKD
ncbi:Proteasome subunit beta type-1, partial [Fragariocoptes setiger]